MYEVDIEAAAANHSAKQHLQIAIKDVSKPVIILEKPRPNENVGTDKPGTIETETLVRFFDAESNTPIKNGSVTLNNLSLIQDATDPQMWKGKITVPEGGANVSLTGVLADKTPVKSTTKLFNKRNTINPSYLAVNPGVYLGFFDVARGMFGKIGLAASVWHNYIQNSILQNLVPTYGFNSGQQHIYLFEPTSERLLAFGVANSIPTIFYGGYIPGVVDLTYDTTNRRLIVLTKHTDAGFSRYRVLAMTADNTKGFADAQTESSSFTPAVTELLWDVPSDIIQGTFKSFNFHRASKTYIVADERNINNIRQTLVQGFTEDGQKKFEATVGADSSNMAVDQAARLVYIAQNHNTANGKIKAINIDTGEAHDLVESYGAINLGAYTNIQMDNVYKRVYIGDDVSDSVFVVDLATHAMSELVFGPATIVDPGEN
jgi:hypothetical protein